MAREHGTEDTTSGTSKYVQPAFQLVGAPDVRKYAIANELSANRFTARLATQTFLQAGHQPYGLGLMADYRFELKIAAHRATRMFAHDIPTISTHSLIDSLAYSLIRVETQQNAGVSEQTRETWIMTMGLIGAMLRDTFKADEIFFLMGDFDDETSFDQAKIQQTLGFILDEFQHPYTIIDPADFPTALNDIGSIMEHYID